MTDSLAPTPPPDPLDRLVDELLSCGGVLSQIIGGMIEFQASGRSAPDAAPIPEVAHALIRDVLHGVEQHHSKRDIKVAATIVEEATTAMCDEIFAVDPAWIDEIRSENGGSASDT